MMQIARHTATLTAAAAVLLCTAAPRVAAAEAPPVSPIGDDQQVFAIAASPAYATTGVVVAAAGTLSGTDKRLSLFVSQDGGATWGRAAGTGWDGGTPVIAMGPSGREVLLAGTSKGVQRSDDLGQSWARIGDGGIPSFMPDFAHDGAIAVGGTHDYVLRNGAQSSVAGSSGALQDYDFAFMPASTSGGAQWAPVLLSGVDPHTDMSAVERCAPQLACTGPATSLAGTSAYSGPPTLLPSTAYASDGTVFARTSMAIFKSTDGGATFAPLAVSPTSAGTTYPSMALAPHYSERGGVRTAYVTELEGATQGSNPKTDGGVYRTTDGGATWTHLGAGTQLTAGAMALAVAPDGRVFASYMVLSGTGIHGGLLCSVDSGASWRGTCPAVGTAKQRNAAISMASIPTAASKAPGAAAGAGANGAGGVPSAAAGAGTNQGGAGRQPARPVATDPMHTSSNWRFPVALAVATVLLSLSLAVGRLRRRRAAAETSSTPG